MGELYLPVLHYFENGNSFTGSLGALRFLVTPDAEQLQTKIWHGLYCLEKSEVAAERVFPLTQEGRSALGAWLEELARAANEKKE